MHPPHFQRECEFMRQLTCRVQKFAPVCHAFPGYVWHLSPTAFRRLSTVIQCSPSVVATSGQPRVWAAVCRTSPAPGQPHGKVVMFNVSTSARHFIFFFQAIIPFPAGFPAGFPTRKRCRPCQPFFLPCPPCPSTLLAGWGSISPGTSIRCAV